MEKYEINKYLEKFKSSVDDLRLALNNELLEQRLKELNEEIVKENFWSDSKKSNKVIAELNDIKEKVNTINKINTGLQDVLDAYEMYDLEENSETLEFLEELIRSFDEFIEEVTIKVILNDEYDDNDVILEIKRIPNEYKLTFMNGDNIISENLVAFKSEIIYPIMDSYVENGIEAHVHHL